MQLAERAFKKFDGVVAASEIDWNLWLKPSDTARVIPAENLAEEGKKRLLLGAEAEPGLTLPWRKCAGKVLIRPRMLAVWTGWTHHGKSLMLKQLMLSAIEQGEKVLIASMEEEVRDIWNDMAIIACGST